MNEERKYYKIGQLERLTKIPRRTIHFYLQNGLLHAPMRTGKTMAYYDDSHIRRLSLIKSSKKKGMPLVAIRRIIEGRKSVKGKSEPRNEGRTNIEKARTHLPRKKAGRVMRKRIIEEGAVFFQEKGFKDNRVNDFIDRLNIGKGSFY
jgi:DNA-binding transcriptional MerR regulator